MVKNEDKKVPAEKVFYHLLYVSETKATSP